MQDPNEDTEWNDILRRKGIIPPKEDPNAIKEDAIVHMLEQAIAKQAAGRDLESMNLDKLNEEEDDIDEEEERIFEQYRRQRIAEMRAAQARARYGDVTEITKTDWVREVNQAGDGVWVVVHVYRNEIPLCKLINEHMHGLARKFAEVKFLKSVSSVCIPNYPDKNLPTIFAYLEGDMKKQWVGPMHFGGMQFKMDEMEWMLHEVGVLKTEMEGPPRQKVEDEMSRAMKRSQINDGDSDEDDW